MRVQYNEYCHKINLKQNQEVQIIMPNLNGKEYPYTKAGKEKHKKDKEKKKEMKNKPKMKTNSGMRKYRI